MNETDEVGWVVFRADEEPTLPLDPGKEAFDDLAPLVATQPAAILDLWPAAVGAMRSDRLGVLFAQLRVKLVAVIRAVADQVLGSCLNHIEVEGQLHERDFVIAGDVGCDCQRQAMAVDYRHDFDPSSVFRQPDLLTATLGRGEGRVDLSLGLVDAAFLAQRGVQVGLGRADDLVLAPLLRGVMHRLVVRIGLRKHVPLRASVEYPQDVLEDLA